MRLTNDKIRKLIYTKTKTDPSSGKKSFPKQILWDQEPRGFGVRVFPSGHRAFVYQYRTEEGVKRLMTLGSVGELSIDTAKDLLRKNAPTVRSGGDPLETRRKSRHGQLMSDLCHQYIEQHAKPNKKSWREDERRVKLYIVPLLGKKQVQTIRRQDIAALMNEIGVKAERKDRKTGKVIGHGKPTTANRVLENLSKMFDLAVDWGYVDESFKNPARGIKSFEEHERDAYVKLEDWPILARAIENEENPVAKLVIWMYVLTGKRRNEILEARWSDLDEKSRILKLAPLGRHKDRKRGTTKGGDVEYLPLSDEVLGIIERAKAHKVVGCDYIFPGHKQGHHFVNIRKPWERIKQEAVANGAESVRDAVIHSLRHTVAVWLINHGDADTALVGKVLNQRSLLATKKYAKYKIGTVDRALQAHAELIKAHSGIRSAEAVKTKEVKPKRQRSAKK